MGRISLYAGPALVLAFLVNAQPLRPNPASPPPDLKSARPLATLAGIELRLETECWIDAMPPVPQDGALLHALVNIVALKAAIPKGMEIVQAWLIRGEGPPLAAEDIETPPSGSPNRIAAVATFRVKRAEAGAVRVSVELEAPSSRVHLTSSLVEVGRVN